VIFGLIVLAGGCSLKSREVIKYYSFDYPPPSKESTVPIPETLMVYRFLLDPSVDMYSLVLSRSKGGEESIQSHRWRDNPADMVTELVLRDIQSSGLFEKVVDQASNSRYRYALEGTVRRLRGVTGNGKVVAGIEAEATLTDFDAPRHTQKTIMQRSYNIETTSKDSTADAVVRALNSAVQEFSAKLRGDIKAAMEKEVPASKQRMRRKVDLGMPESYSHDIPGRYVSADRIL
jgi:ABC-type uncharacterized transport system auxiliary subunit